MPSTRIQIANLAAAIVIGSIPVAHAFGQEASQTDAPKVRKSEAVFRGSATRRVEPTYPQSAKDARISGAVVVEVTVGENGDVIAARTISGHPLLQDAALEAARGWKFSPTQLSGVPIKVIGSLTFNFSPDSNNKPSDSDNGEIERAKQAVKTNAYSPEAHFKLAQAYVSEQMYEQAIEPYRRAIELKPIYKEAYIGLALAYRRLDKRDEEVETYRQGIAALPKDIDLLQSTARVLSETERYAEAIDIQRRIIQLRPDDPVSHEQLGQYLFRTRRYLDAISSYQESARLRPNNAFPLHSIAAAYLNLGRWEDAIA